MIKKIYLKLKENNIKLKASSITFFLLINGGSLFFLLGIILNTIDFKKFDIVIDSRLSELIDFFKISYFVPNYYILILTSIWSASSFFYEILKIGEGIYNIKRNKPFIIKRIISIILFILFLVLIVFLIIFISFSNVIINNIHIIFIKYLVNTISFFLLPILIIIYIFIFIPPIKIKFKNIIRGSIFTSIGWYLITYLFKLYLNTFKNFKIIYGQISFIIIIMIYLYMIIYITIVGFIINFLEIVKEKIEIKEII